MKRHSFDFKQYYHRWAVTGAILIAALLRLPSLKVQSIAFDEGYSIAVGSAAWPTLFQATLSSGVHPPLFYILYKMALPLWGINEFGARFMIAVFGLLTVPLTYKLGELMFKHQTGMVAATLMAINPVHIWLSQEARMYGLLIMLTTTSMLVFWQALRTGRRRYWISLTMVNALAFNLHYFGLWIPVVQFAVFISNFGRYFGQFRRWVAAQFVAGLALLPWIGATALRESQSFGIGFLSKPNLMDLPLTLWNFTIGFSTSLWWPIVILSLGLFTVIALVALRRSERKFHPARMMLVLWVFVPLLFVWIISQRRSFYADRYLSFVVPGVVLLLAFGISRVKRLAWRILLVGGLVAASVLGVIATRLDPTFFKDDWRSAVAYITHREQPEDVILLYSTHIKFPFDYYYQGNAPQKPISLNLEHYPIEPLISGHRRAWVVYPYTRRPTHYPMQPLIPNGYWESDPNRNPELVKWFETHANDVIGYQHFSGIQVWLVDLETTDLRSERQ